MRNLQECGWSVFSYSLVFLITFFNIFPIFALLTNELVIESAYLRPNLGNEAEVVFFMFVLIFSSFLLYYAGYNYSRKNNSRSSIWYYKWKSFFIKDIMIVAISICSLLGLILYIKGFGSFSKAIESANIVRSGYYKVKENADTTAHTFFFRFIFLSIIPFIYYFTLNIKKNYHTYIFVISGTILVVLYTFLSSGRQSIIDLFLIFILSHLFLRQKLIDLKLFVYVIVILVSLPILDVFFINRSISNQGHQFDLLKMFINEFGFPFYSLYYAIVEDYTCFFFSDFVTGLFGKILPTSFAPNWEKTNTLNTLYMTGHFGRSYVPPGLLAQGYYSFGVLGVYLICFFTGLFFQKVDHYFNNLIKLDNKYIYIYCYVIVHSLTWVRTALPANYFYNFPFMILGIFMVVSIKLKSDS